MLQGVLVKSLKLYSDERGHFTEMMRSNWKDIIGKDILVQTNFSVTYPGVIRAWHKHVKGQIDYFVVLKGSLKICVYDDQSRELNEIITSGYNLKVVRVPGNYWHGFKAFGDEPSWLIYFTTKLYDYNEPDELRKKWDDLTVIPRSINGREDDERVNSPWDWNRPPYK